MSSLSAPDRGRLPQVSCILSAYNYERYVELAIDSVLQQDYPPERLHVIVVDDGSTDRTPEVVRAVQERYGNGRLSLIQRRNGGNTASVATGLKHIRGELVGILDADDQWLPGKVREQAELFASRPEVSLVYGDMQVIDGCGAVLDESFFARMKVDPPRGRVIDRLIGENFTTNSTLMFRAADVVPLPARSPSPDYWLAAHAAAAGETEVIRRPLANYRLHEANRGFGAHGDRYVAVLRRELLGRRQIIADLFRAVSIDGLLTALAELEAKALWTSRLGTSSLEQVIDVQDDERVLAASELARGLGESDLDERVRTLARARVLDPFNHSAGVALTEALAQRAAPPAVFLDSPPAVSVDGRRRRPRVSVVIPAFNLAHFLPAAIDSALGQDPPGGEVEVIVVDDGSTDETQAVLARYGDRIRTIRQANSGLLAAVDRGLEEVGGHYVALLDADDEWPRDRLRRHADLLDAQPLVGLVHGDMEVIDSAGHVREASFFSQQREPPTDGRVLGRLLAGNFISGGAATFRASLLPAVHPVTPEAAYPDWWIAACISAVAEIRIAPGIANRYRYHGANMGLGSGPDAQPRIQRHELEWRRWMLWNLIDDETVTVEHVRTAFMAWRYGIATAATQAGGGARSLLNADGAGARAALACADRAGAQRRLSKTLLRALSRDPFDGAIAIDLELALGRDSALAGEAGHAPSSPPPPLIALATRPLVTIAWLQEIVADRSLLHAFGQEAAGRADSTLVVLAPPAESLQKLITIVEADPALNGESCDITVLAEPSTTPARLLLASRAHARLTAGPSPAPYDALPVHTALARARATTSSQAG